MLVVQIIIAVLSAGGFIMMLASLPGIFNQPHILSLVGLVLATLSIFIKIKWLKSVLFIAGALSFALFVGYLVMVVNAMAAI